MSVEVQWTDEDPDTGAKRFVCVDRFAREWRFRVRARRRENWERPKRVTREMWEVLVDGLDRRHQRGDGVSDDDLAAARKILAALPPDC